jgi:hypothetical protein
MLINGWVNRVATASALLKMAHLGPLIGRRTWEADRDLGALIWWTAAASRAHIGIYSTDGKWIVEGTA